MKHIHWPKCNSLGYWIFKIVICNLIYVAGSIFLWMEETWNGTYVWRKCLWITWVQDWSRRTQIWKPLEDTGMESIHECMLEKYTKMLSNMETSNVHRCNWSLSWRTSFDIVWRNWGTSELFWRLGHVQSTLTEFEYIMAQIYDNLNSGFRVLDSYFLLICVHDSLNCSFNFVNMWQPFVFGCIFFIYAAMAH